MKLSHIRNKNKQLGQGMTEYIIIVALIAVSAITVYSLFGQTLRHQAAGLAAEMSGGNAADNISAAKDDATAAKGDADITKKMGSYSGNNEMSQGQ